MSARNVNRDTVSLSSKSLAPLVKLTFVSISPTPLLKVLETESQHFFSSFVSLFSPGYHLFSEKEQMWRMNGK